jgi:hypothetical protein
MRQHHHFKHCGTFIFRLVTRLLLVEIVFLSSVWAQDSDAGNVASSNASIFKNVIDDMDRLHEAKPNGGGPGWKTHPLIVMGAYPYAWSIPDGWSGVRFKQWTAILPWFLMYQEADANIASNSAIEIKNFQIFVFRTSANRWVKLGAESKARWSSAAEVNAKHSTKDPFKFNSKFGELFQPSSSFMIHGGLKQYELPWDNKTNKADISAICVTIEHRLQLIDEQKADDRDSARYLVLVGADYYPFVGATMQDLKAVYNPGVGMGRFMKSNKNWRLSSFVVKIGSVSWSHLLKSPPQIYSHGRSL